MQSSSSLASSPYAVPWAAPADDSDDPIEVITIRVEDLVEVDETEGLGVISGVLEAPTRGGDTRSTCIYAVPPMPALAAK